MPDIVSLFPPSKFQQLAGRLEPDEVRSRLKDLYPHEKRDRWFAEHPFHDSINDKTYVLSKGWGTKTESQLRRLSDAFPDAKVSFRKAEAEDG